VICFIFLLVLWPLVLFGACINSFFQLKSNVFTSRHRCPADILHGQIIILNTKKQ
jgi:hypothetical protein